MPKCLYCGISIKIGSRPAKKFCCIECRRNYHNQQRSLNKDCVCIICGKKLSGRQKKYCSAKCDNKAHSIRMSQQREADFAEARKYKNMKPKEPVKPKVSLEEVARLAKEKGMTAGQLVAKYGL